MPYIWIKTQDSDYDITELDIKTEGEAEELRASCTVAYVEQGVLDAWHAFLDQRAAWNTLWRMFDNEQFEARERTARPPTTWVGACRYCGCTKPPSMGEGQDWPRCPECKAC